MTAMTPPGSLGAPFLGEVRQFLADPYAFTLSRTREHGNVWKTRLLGDTVVFFAGPEAFTFLTDPANFARHGASSRAVQKLLDPAAVLFLDGGHHARRKQLLLSAFTDEALQSYLPGVFAVFSRFASGWVGRDERPLLGDLSQLAFDVADHLFAAGDPAVSDRQRAAELRAFVSGALAAPVDLPVTAYGKAVRAQRRLREHVRARIAMADGAATGTVLGALSAARGPQGEELDAEQLEIELFHFYFAGHGGLTAALTWSLVVLGEHPELAAQLRREADTVLGDATPSLAQVRQLQTARAVSREILRAYPIVPFTLMGVARRSLELDGFSIPAGWKGAGAVWATLQDPSIFDDPTAFRSDRLGDEAFEALPPGSYVPMGAGPHACAGAALIQLLMPAFLGWFVKHYDWGYPAQDASPSGRAVPARPKDGVRGTVSVRGA